MDAHDQNYFALWNPTLCYYMSLNPHLILTVVPITTIYEDIIDLKQHCNLKLFNKT